MRIRRLVLSVSFVLFLGLLSAVAQATETDVIPPQVVATTPVNGAQNVDPGLDGLRVTFSEQMSDGSWSWVYENESTFPEMIGQPHYENGGTTCALPVRLEPGRTYVIWLNSERFRNFKDEAGNTLPPYRWEFRTAE